MRKAVTKAQITLPHLWTEHTTNTKAQFSLSDMYADLIGHYSQSNAKFKLDRQLAYTVNQIRLRDPHANIIVAGNLNRSPEQACNLARELNLQ